MIERPDQHQIEIEANKKAWESKPLLRKIYGEFYAQIAAAVNPAIPGCLVEIGSGIGNLKNTFPEAICTDLFPNPWLDLACDAYELPFSSGSISHLVLFDVFHHLEAPVAFLKEARRVLAPGGRLLIFEPFISPLSWIVYGAFHHEPVGWRREMNMAEEAPRPRRYYAAQGNATRLFFKEQLPETEWKIVQRKIFVSFTYLLSGGFSKPAFYPGALIGMVRGIDQLLQPFSWLFGARCLVVLERQ